jgi:NAD(P)-dependent dehydrogenase (short-subunit alcohol dehydrogenase family)
MVAEARGEPSALAVSVSQVCVQLGAGVSAVSLEPESVGGDALDAAVVDAGEIDLLAVDGAGLFAGALASGGDAHVALRTCMDCAWNATRAVVNHAFLPVGGGGRIVYLAPAPQAGPHAEAARAGLENLARTLSVEWARHAITLVTIALGDTTTPGEAAALTAYLASPAGAYFSGAQLDLRGA